MDVELNASQIVKEARQNTKENNIVYSTKPHPPKKTNRKAFRRPLRNPQRQGYAKPLPQRRIQRQPQRNASANTQGRRITRRLKKIRAERNTRLLIRNLTKKATNEDLRDMFEKAGPLKRCGINWNDIGESKGTADVEYLYEKDARDALRRFDYKHIRGVPIRVEMKGQQSQSSNYRSANKSNRTQIQRSRRYYPHTEYHAGGSSRSSRYRSRDNRRDYSSNRHYQGQSSGNSRRRYKNYNNFN